MKKLMKLTISVIKMHFRDKGAVIWTLLFPFIIILIFGLLDFNNAESAKIGFVYNEKSKEYVTSIKEVLSQIGNRYKFEEGNLDEEKKALAEDDRLLVMDISVNEENKVNIKAYLNKSNELSAQSTLLIIQKTLSDFELQLNRIEPLFNVESEVVNVNELRNIDYLVPGVVAMSLMQSGLFGVVGTIVTYREKGILKRLFATPLPKSTFLISQILSRLLISILQVIILLVSSYIVFKINIVGSLFLVALTATLGSITFLALGFTVSGIAKTTESARAIMMPINMLMMFTSGVYFSRDVLPNWLYDITQFTPLTYLSDGLRDVMTKGYNLTDITVRTAIIGLSVWLVVFIIISIKTFKWEKNA